MCGAGGAVSLRQSRAGLTRPGRSRFAAMEPVLGFEPRTDGLQNRCSTTELNWPGTRNDCGGGRAFGASNLTAPDGASCLCRLAAGHIKPQARGLNGYNPERGSGQVDCLVIPNLHERACAGSGRSRWARNRRGNMEQDDLAKTRAARRRSPFKGGCGRCAGENRKHRGHRGELINHQNSNDTGCPGKRRRRTSW